MRKLLSTLMLLTGCSVQGAAEERWERIVCPSHGNPIERFYLPLTSEDASDRLEDWRALDGSQHARATLSQGQGRNGEADKALEISYAFVGKTPYEYVALASRLPIEKPGCYLGLWAWVDGDGGWLRFRARTVRGLRRATTQLPHSSWSISIAASVIIWPAAGQCFWLSVGRAP